MYSHCRAEQYNVTDNVNTFSAIRMMATVTYRLEIVVVLLSSSSSRSNDDDGDDDDIDNNSNNCFSH